MARPKKINHFKLKPFKNTAGSQSWRVTGTKADGTRVRQNFANKSEAVQTLADLEGEIDGHVEVSRAQRTRLSAEELADAESAVLGVAGRQLSRIVSHYLSLEARAKAKGINLDAALAFAEAHYRSEVKAVSVLGAYDEFVASRTTGSPKTKIHYESSLRLLLKPDPNKPLHTFTVSDIEKILGQYKNVNSRRTYRRAFAVFFNWSVRHHYCLEDPCKRLDKIPKDMSQIAILSLDEVRRLLYAAICYQDGAAAAPVAIALFAGLRPSEISDLKPEDIGAEKIRVSGGKLRRKLKRTTPIPPNLATWLEKYPFNGLPDGWAYKMKQLKAATKAAIWVQDILRHTSITFQVERDENMPSTAFNCGTSVQMMDLHYRNFIDDPAVLAAFWSLTPANVLAKKPKVKLPNTQRIKWPAKSALEKLVWQKPLTRASADIGVSDVSLKKRCVKLGINLPLPGHWARQRRDHGESR
jgi:integrase